MATGDLAWKLHRLKAMTLPEIPYRVIKAWKNQIRRHAAKSLRKVDQVPVHFSHAKYRPETFLSHLRDRGAPYFYIDVESRDGETCLGPGTLANADRVLNGRIDIGAIAFHGMPPDWHADPTTHATWPMLFQGDIQVRNRDDIGDVRVVWELNRMQWLFDVAVCYRYTGDDRYAERIEGIIDHWIEANPVDVGINWMSGMESAIRAQTWIWLAFLLCRCDRPRLSTILVHGIWSHLRHVEENLSQFSSANNHLIIEAATLFVAGLVFPEFEASTRWRRAAERIIAREVPRQLRPDGVSAEQSVHYHAFVLEALLMMTLLAEKNGISMDAVVESRIQGMVRFLTVMTDDKGRVPQIGDSDDGRVSPLSCEAESYYSYLLVLGRRFAEGAIPVAHTSTRARWVTGEDMTGSDRPSNPCTTPLVMTSFADSGYVVTRDTASSRVITFDAGPHGLERLCAHAHADALSVTLSVRGVDVLADPGTYIYNIRRQQRDEIRSTAAHSTVMVDGRSQSEPGGPFVWISKTDATLEHSGWGSWFTFAVGYHDGYTPIRHTRFVLVVHDMMIVGDRLHGDSPHGIEGAHSYRQAFTLGKDIRHRDIDGGWMLDHTTGPMATVLMSNWPGQSLAVNSLASSSRFSEVYSAQQLTGELEAEGEVRMVSLCHTDNCSPTLIERSEGALVLESGGSRSYVLSGQYRTAELHFEGDFLYLKRSPRGEIDKLFAHGCHVLSFGGQDMADLITGPHRQVTVN